MGEKIITMETEYACTLLPAENVPKEVSYMMTNFNLILGYDYDIWYDYGLKEPVITTISTTSNSHINCCGMSGSGKSYATKLLLARFALAIYKK